MITPMVTRLKKSHEALWSYGPYLAEIAHKTWWQCLLA